MILEPVQGEGGFIEMPADFPARLRELCDRHGILWIDDEVQSGVGRTGPVWAIEHYGRAARPAGLAASRSAAACRWRPSPGPAEIMDAVDPGGLGGTFGGNPVSCAAANVVLDQVPAHARAAPRRSATTLRAALEDIATRVDTIGEVRGLGPMLALEIVRDRETKTPAPDVVGAAVAKARGEGLLLLACGLHGNVIRLLPPLTITDDELATRPGDPRSGVGVRIRPCTPSTPSPRTSSARRPRSCGATTASASAGASRRSSSRSRRKA